MLATGASFSSRLVSTHSGCGGLDHQFHRHQHRRKAGGGYGRQHLRHDPVATGVAPQALHAALQRRWHVGKRRSIAQCAGLALEQRDVVLPVVADLLAIDDALMVGDDHVAGDHAHACRVQARADHLAGQLAKDRVAIAMHGDEAGG